MPICAWRRWANASATAAAAAAPVGRGAGRGGWTMRLSGRSDDGSRGTRSWRSSGAEDLPDSLVLFVLDAREEIRLLHG